MAEQKKKSNRGGARKGAGRKSKMEEARIRDLVSPYLPQAIETVVAIMQNENAKNSDRYNAAKLMLEYGFGKPQQSVDLTSKGDKMSVPVISFDNFKDGKE